MKSVLILMLLIVFVTADYWETRENFITKEESLAIGSKILLTPKEKRVNMILMAAKNKEIEEGFLNPGNFSPAIHFFQSKNQIEKSTVFKFIQKMPKGGALHIHDSALVSLEYVIQNITYLDNLYACQKEDLNLIFAGSPPDDKCWVPLKYLREKANSNEEFDYWLRGKLSLVTDHPYEEYSDINIVWERFQNIFELQTPMILYRPVYIDYIYRALEEFYEDNVNYMELRGSFPKVYELDGTSLNATEVLDLLKEISDKFMQHHPDFLGVKYIYSTSRKIENNNLIEDLEIFKIMNSKYPDFLVGFDLVGQEDLGRPLVEFIEILLNYSPEVKFYFHAGETNWNGLSTDLNLVDAVLMNTTRIGHGSGVLKHSSILEAIKQNNIAIEICPLSNQILNLVKDLRNHPANFLFANNYPVVISSDDPAFWGAKGLSYDFYEAFMAFARKNADLKLLKQLALNSLVYSSMKTEEKGEIISKFLQKWDQFIDDVYVNGI